MNRGAILPVYFLQTSFSARASLAEHCRHASVVFDKFHVSRMPMRRWTKCDGPKCLWCSRTSTGQPTPGRRGIDSKCGAAGCARVARFHKASLFASMVKLAQMVENHLAGIVAHWKWGLTNAFMERLNSVFSATKHKARGYRSTSHLTTMLYFVAGKLGLPQF